ncbi:MAG: hypothetical protein KDB94_05435, partial [Acidobacteria bacterium]|nr:hypothetical protein [Acidobacteriota bacterium]
WPKSRSRDVDRGGGAVGSWAQLGGAVHREIYVWDAEWPKSRSRDVDRGIAEIGAARHDVVALRLGWSSSASPGGL